MPQLTEHTNNDLEFTQANVKAKEGLLGVTASGSHTVRENAVVVVPTKSSDWVSYCSSEVRREVTCCCGGSWSVGGVVVSLMGFESSEDGDGVKALFPKAIFSSAGPLASSSILSA